MGNAPKKDETKNNHSNFRKGLTDYGDGANVSHYLGNDDYEEGANLPETDFGDNEMLEGKGAGGNMDMPKEDNASEKDKAEGDDLRPQP